MKLAVLALSLIAGNAAANQPAAVPKEKAGACAIQTRSAVQSEAHSPAPFDLNIRARERIELLERGEASLCAGDVEAAMQAFDRAASIQHAPDAEMGLVRAQMQGGHYRRALAFAAHPSVAHSDAAGGALLYAWLLQIGGQGALARKLLDETQARLPADAQVAAVRRELLSAAPLATETLLNVPSRMAPYGGAAGLPNAVRTAGSGVLIDNGKRALVPLSSLTAPRSGAVRIWVRNGLGTIMPATVQTRNVATGIAVLILDSPLPVNGGLAMAPRDAFPGSIAHAVEYVASNDGVPRWPVLSTGFLGPAQPGSVERQLGIDLPAGPRGGPVFDAVGRFVGMALPGQPATGKGKREGKRKGPDRVVLASHLDNVMGEHIGRTGEASPGARVPVDQIYESAMKLVVQVIAAR